MTGCTLTSWDYPVADDRTTMIAGIENVTGNVTITVVGSLPKLDTPTGLSITDDTLTFDAVENAEQYEVFAGNTSLGTYSVQTGEIWLLNETLDVSTLDADFTVDFVSNNVSYSAINGQGSGLDYDSTTVYYDGGPGGFVWADEAYRTITFAQPVTDTALLTWLQANGTKQ